MRLRQPVIHILSNYNMEPTVASVWCARHSMLCTVVCVLAERGPAVSGQEGFVLLGFYRELKKLRSS